MSDDVLVRVEGVSKKFCRDLKRSLWYGVKDAVADLVGRPTASSLRSDEFWAVDDVSFELRRGECLGLIGRNGAGKTSLLKMLNGLIKPDKGRIQMRGRVAAIIALGAGFNPILTGRENIYVNASIMGLSKRETDDKIDDIIDFAEIREFIDAPVQSYSSGMVVRLGFAVATAVEPDVLLLDEVLAVGDANFRSKCWRRLGDRLSATAVILVSHDAYAIQRLCDRAILLNRGKRVIDTSADMALIHYADMQETNDIHGFVALNDDIKEVIFESSIKTLEPGGFYDFDASITTHEDVKIDHAVINICDMNQEVHAQCAMEFPGSRLSRGVNHFTIRVGPLFLSRRRFYLLILIYSNGGKTPLIHSRAQLCFDFKGHVSYGPKYYPPVVVGQANSVVAGM